MKRRLLIGVLLAAGTLALAGPAAACPVCFGEAESGIIDGVRWAIVFMGALVYALIGGGIALVIALRRRVRRLQDPHRGLKLVPPLAGSKS